MEAQNATTLPSLEASGITASLPPSDDASGAPVSAPSEGKRHAAIIAIEAHTNARRIAPKRIQAV